MKKKTMQEIANIFDLPACKDKNGEVWVHNGTICRMKEFWLGGVHDISIELSELCSDAEEHDWEIPVYPQKDA